MAGSEMTTQVVRKRFPLEKVGNVVDVDGKVQIIEYSDLPDAAAQAVDDNGELRLWAGNIAVHVIDVDFLRRVSRSADALPFHRASKKVPFVDATGQNIEPAEPNATKFERFIFDLLPAAENAFVVESLPARHSRRSRTPTVPPPIRLPPRNGDRRVASRLAPVGGG